MAIAPVQLLFSAPFKTPAPRTPTTASKTTIEIA
jgi:hypothetical protein